MMDRLSSPDSDLGPIERQLEAAKVVIGGADRMLRTAREFFRREHEGPLPVMPPGNPGRHPASEGAPMADVVPITSAPSYRPPAEGDLVDTGQHQRAETARAEIRQIHSLQTPDLTLEDIHRAGQEAA